VRALLLNIEGDIGGDCGNLCDAASGLRVGFVGGMDGWVGAGRLGGWLL